MKLRPVLTEKSLNDAKKGVYTFWVAPHATKFGVKKLIAEIFDVTVATVKTINYKKGTRKNVRGRIVTTAARKKAMVTLKGKGSIDIFETKKK